MKRWAAVIFVALCAIAHAQTPSPSPSATGTPEPTPRLPIWRCDLPGGTYEVAIRAIVSVSSHEYIVDGAARVIEVNIDTQGNMAARFYFIEPVAAKTPLGVGQSAVDRISELAKEAGQRTGADDVWQRVVKSYPTTTHAHTIEYRVASEEQLKQILSSAREAFESGRGATFQLTNQ